MGNSQFHHCETLSSRAPARRPHSPLSPPASVAAVEANSSVRFAALGLLKDTPTLGMNGKVNSERRALAGGRMIRLLALPAPSL